MAKKIRSEQVSGGGGGSSIDYSDIEQPTGNYFFGKPIYQKTILYRQALPSAGGTSGIVTFPHGIQDMKEVIDIVGVVNDPSAKIYVRTPHVGTAQANESISFYVAGDYITLKVGQNRSTYTNNHVTVYYTKSAD